DNEVVDLVLDKQRFYQLGENRKYLTPKTYTLNQVLECSDLEFPIIAKPNARRTSSNDGSAIKNIESQLDRLRLTEIYDSEYLKQFLQEEKDYLPFLIFQQLIPGLSDQ